MNVEISNREVLFQKGGCLAGRYVLDDPFKPHFAILNTTAGHNVTLVSPADHRHHKGLMYALRCADLNFWEEDPDGGTCGVQEVLDTHPIVNGIRQTLLWRALEGDRPTYRESREITCTLAADGGGYHWLWRTRREALRNHRLIKSEWSMALPDGRKINYHGLGLRLPWMWAFNNDAFCGIEIAGEQTPALAASGQNGSAVTWWGRIDGQWNPTAASVTIRQAQDFTTRFFKVSL